MYTIPDPYYIQMPFTFTTEWHNEISLLRKLIKGF